MLNYTTFGNSPAAKILADILNSKDEKIRKKALSIFNRYRQLLYYVIQIKRHNFGYDYEYISLIHEKYIKEVDLLSDPDIKPFLKNFKSI